MLIFAVLGIRSAKSGPNEVDPVMAAALENQRRQLTLVWATWRMDFTARLRCARLILIGWAPRRGFFQKKRRIDISRSRYGSSRGERESREYVRRMLARWIFRTAELATSWLSDFELIKRCLINLAKNEGCMNWRCNFQYQYSLLPKSMDFFFRRIYVLEDISSYSKFKDIFWIIAWEML